MEPAECDEALRSQFPSLAFDRARPVPEQGWDFFTFDVDGEWIFRFPRDAAAAVALKREFALLPIISPRLTVAVPRYDWTGSWNGLPFGGYRLIEGQPFEPGALSVPIIARELGHALHALHGVPVELAAARLDEPVSGAGWVDSQRRFLLAARQAAESFLDADERAYLDELTAAYLDLAGSSWPASLVHQDLGPVHILGASDAITGIIDWSDMTIGDPAVDFAGILGAAGEGPFSLVADSYNRPAGDDFERRVRYYACIAPLHDILHGVDVTDGAIVREGVEGFARRRPLWQP